MALERCRVMGCSLDPLPAARITPCIVTSSATRSRSSRRAGPPSGKSGRCMPRPLGCALDSRRSTRAWISSRYARVDQRRCTIPGSLRR